MSKANGWNGCGAGTGVGLGMGVHGNGTSASLHSSAAKYSRSTELRRVEDNDIYRLSKILDENACWRKLMSIIPKGLDVQTSSAAGGLNFPSAVKKGFKYTTQDVRQIDEAANRAADQSKSQMMIDEWKTSGKLHERPTVGVLLQLLVQAELFSAADFVALDFLSEPTPDRPADGPAAPISLDWSELVDEDMDVDNEVLSPATLNAAAQGSVGLNLDNFDKKILPRDKSLPQPSENVPPLAPPRASRLQRESASSRNATSTGTGSTAPNMPNLTILNPSEQVQQTEQVHQPHPQNIPNLSILIASSAASMTTISTSLGPPNSQSSSTDGPNIPQITLLIDDPPATATVAATVTSSNNLPMISALNLNTDNGEGADSRSSSSLSNDEDEVDGDFADASLPNISNSEQHNSNNDSSLTTVTGTSGDNSFELTNDSSSTSNDDYGGNIPNLSELQP
ncbi:hypothetical protein KR009_005901 [Drosophila setifemur]|nr:hypothetical protein KR009_005901 [Drosophila setifemur]